MKFRSGLQARFPFLARFSLQWIGKPTIQKKLVTAFAILILLLSFAGAVSLYYISRIGEQVGFLTQVTSPLNQQARGLVNQMQAFQTHILGLLDIDSASVLDGRKTERAALQADFKKNLSRLSRLVKQENLQISLTSLREKQNVFFEKASQAIEAHQLKLKQEEMESRELDEFDRLRQELDLSLQEFTNAAQDAIGAKEDLGRKLGLSSDTTVQQINGLLLEMFEKDLPVYYQGEQIRTFLIQLQDSVKTFLRLREKKKLDEQEKKFVRLSKKIKSRIRRLKRKLQTEESRQKHKLVQKRFAGLHERTTKKNGLLASHRQYLQANAQVLQLKQELQDTVEQFEKVLAGVAAASLKMDTKVQSETREKVKQAQTFLGGLILVGLVIGVTGAWMILRSITKPVQKAVSLAESISEGDLSNRLHLTQKDEIGNLTRKLDIMADGLERKAQLANAIASGDLSREAEVQSEKDTLGQALHSMLTGLSRMVKELQVMGNQVNAGSDQIAAASQSLSQGATQQAAAIEEINSTMTELESQTRQNAENADEANKLAADVRKVGQEGADQMVEMNTAMQEINHSSKEISKIIKAIDEIAFQTNLLALNAAVEAARAGKHGKGFAVVAQEVRSLASRSAKAAAETADLIEHSIKKVDTGTVIAEKTEAVLQRINQGIAAVDDLIRDISRSSNEQAQGISQLAQGLDQVDAVTQQNTANAEETSSAAVELSSQAEQVLTLLSRFHLNSDG